MVRHVRVQCALIRPQGTKDSTTRDPEVNHSTFNTHTWAHTWVDVWAHVRPPGGWTAESWQAEVERQESIPPPFSYGADEPRRKDACHLVWAAGNTGNTSWGGAE